jgi:hypothetical protein
MKITENLFLGINKSDVGNNDYKPFLNRWMWGTWLPEFSSNGGNFKRGLCTDISVRWLIFSINFLWFRRGKGEWKHIDVEFKEEDK